MNASDFIDAVQRSGDIDSPEAARHITRATLETLGEHIAEGQEDDLAAHLPRELADALTRNGPEPPESFSFEEFLERVSGRAGIEKSSAIDGVRAVIRVLTDVVDEQEIHDTREQLPSEFDLVFEPGEQVDYQEFVDRVQGEAEFGSGDAADRAIRAVLRALGERISAGEAADLATYLPEEVASIITEAAENEPSAFDMDEFVARVAQYEGETKEDAREHIIAVMDVLEDTAGPFEFGKVRSQLPGEFNAFIESMP